MAIRRQLRHISNRRVAFAPGSGSAAVNLDAINTATTLAASLATADVTTTRLVVLA